MEYIPPQMKSSFSALPRAGRFNVWHGLTFYCIQSFNSTSEGETLYQCSVDGSRPAFSISAHLGPRVTDLTQGKSGKAAPSKGVTRVSPEVKDLLYTSDHTPV